MYPDSSGSLREMQTGPAAPGPASTSQEGRGRFKEPQGRGAPEDAAQRPWAPGSRVPGASITRSCAPGYRISSAAYPDPARPVSAPGSPAGPGAAPSLLSPDLRSSGHLGTQAPESCAHPASPLASPVAIAARPSRVCGSAPRTSRGTRVGPGAQRLLPKTAHFGSGPCVPVRPGAQGAPGGPPGRSGTETGSAESAPRLCAKCSPVDRDSRPGLGIPAAPPRGRRRNRASLPGAPLHPFLPVSGALEAATDAAA